MLGLAGVWLLFEELFGLAGVWLLFEELFGLDAGFLSLSDVFVFEVLSFLVSSFFSVLPLLLLFLLDTVVLHR